MALGSSRFLCCTRRIARWLTYDSIRERIWHLLNVEQNRYPTYSAFSNDRWVVNGRSSDYDSIESIHNSLHGMIGGSGHMGDPDYAGWVFQSNIITTQVLMRLQL